MEMEIENNEIIPLDDEVNLTVLAEEYLALRAEKFKREGELEAINEQLEQVNQKINDILQPLERTMFDYKGYKLKQKVNPFPKVKPGKFDEFYEWLKEHNEEGLAKLSIHHGTLKEWYDKHPEFEEELTDFLSAYSKIKVMVYGDKEKEQKAQAYEAFRGQWGKGL